MGDSADRAAWLRKRSQGVGASEVAALFGVSPFQTPFGLYCEKTGQIAPKDISDDPRVRAGVLFEAPIAKWWSEDEGKILKNLGRYTIQRTPRFPRLFATLDRLVVGQYVHPDDTEEPVLQTFAEDEQEILEIKSTSAHRAEEWKDEPPLHVLVQAHAQLAVTGKKKVNVVALVGGQRLVTHEVHRDEEFVGRIVVVVADFWRRVENREPPPVGASDADAIRAVYSTITKAESIALPESLVDVDSDLTKIRRQIADLQVAEEEAMNKIKAAIGGAESGVLPNGVTWTGRVIERAGYEVAPSKYRQFRRKEPK